MHACAIDAIVNPRQGTARAREAPEGKGEDRGRFGSRCDMMERRRTHLVPWPVVRLPFGHMDAHPRRSQEEQGIVLLHLSLRRRHSAQEIAPRARLSSCSCCFTDRSLFSPFWRWRVVGGMTCEKGGSAGEWSENGGGGGGEKRVWDAGRERETAVKKKRTSRT